MRTAPGWWSGAKADTEPGLLSVKATVNQQTYGPILLTILRYECVCYCYGSGGSGGTDAFAFDPLRWNTGLEVVSTYCDIQLMGQPDGVGYIKAPWEPSSQLQRMAEVHHLHVMRRSAVMPWLDELARWDGWEEYVLMGLLCRYGVHHHIPQRLYRFRQHNAYHRAGMIGGQAMRRAATKTVAPFLAPLIAAGVRQADAG